MDGVNWPDLLLRFPAIAILLWLMLQERKRAERAEERLIEQQKQHVASMNGYHTEQTKLLNKVMSSKGGAEE